jgi:hypothetical protein
MDKQEQDKELREKIARIIREYGRSCVGHSGFVIDPMYLGQKHKDYLEITTDIINLFKEAGYIKRPDELPLLTEDEMLIVSAVSKYPVKAIIDLIEETCKHQRDKDLRTLGKG